MSNKRRKLDLEKMEFAEQLIRQNHRLGASRPITSACNLMTILQFGGLTMQDWLDYVEAEGVED